MCTKRGSVAYQGDGTLAHLICGSTVDSLQGNFQFCQSRLVTIIRILHKFPSMLCLAIQILENVYCITKNCQGFGPIKILICEVGACNLLWMSHPWCVEDFVHWNTNFLTDVYSITDIHLNLILCIDIQIFSLMCIRITDIHLNLLIFLDKNSKCWFFTDSYWLSSIIIHPMCRFLPVNRQPRNAISITHSSKVHFYSFSHMESNDQTNFNEDALFCIFSL